MITPVALGVIVIASVTLTVVVVGGSIVFATALNAKRAMAMFSSKEFIGGRNMMSTREAEGYNGE